MTTMWSSGRQFKTSDGRLFGMRGAKYPSKLRVQFQPRKADSVIWGDASSPIVMRPIWNQSKPHIGEALPRLVWASCMPPRILLPISNNEIDLQPT